VKTKLPHYTLIAFPLLSLLLARHIFELPGFFVEMLRRRFPSLRDRVEARASSRFPVRTALIALAVSLAMSLFVFRLIAPNILTAELFKKVEKDLHPEMRFAHINYGEPSVVWYFRSRVRQKHVPGISVDRVDQFMMKPGARFLILPTQLARTVYPEIPPGWKSYSVQGYNFVKGKRTDLTLILKPIP
jgi:hypothetical protein